MNVRTIDDKTADGTDGAIVGGGREPDKIIRRHQLRAVSGYSIGHIYELIKQGRFPRPVPLGAARCRVVRA